jgi:hypothetical protein
MPNQPVDYLGAFCVGSLKGNKLFALHWVAVGNFQAVNEYIDR